ncbi:hypothetical protein KY358_02950 [Candidatus Woesearchaeota archaeon]|nr:hypothetical protein [Candidatus Woesearchaeota archaeon]
MIDYEGLLKKGFSKEEASRTIKILRKAEEQKPSGLRFLDTVIYWVLLIVAIIGNMVIAVILVPFLLTFKRVPLYLTIIILAAMFGFLFDQLIRDIKNLENKHMIVAWAFIPALATINTYYMTSFSNHLTRTFDLALPPHSPVIVSLAYVSAFMLPYILQNLLGSTSRI